MQVQIDLMDGTNIVVDSENYNVSQTFDKFNNNAILAFAIGKIIVNKGAVKSVIPLVEEEGLNTVIEMSDGKNIKVKIDDYDPEMIVEIINNPVQRMALIGDVIVNKSYIKLITPIEKDEQ